MFIYVSLIFIRAASLYTSCKYTSLWSLLWQTKINISLKWIRINGHTRKTYPTILYIHYDDVIFIVNFFNSWLQGHGNASRIRQQKRRIQRRLWNRIFQYGMHSSESTNASQPLLSSLPNNLTSLNDIHFDLNKYMFI